LALDLLGAGDVDLAVYHRRQPQKTVLWQVISQNLRTFQAATEESGRPLPDYVWKEFERYLNMTARAWKGWRDTGCDQR
jgi:hypothetical protein